MTELAVMQDADRDDDNVVVAGADDSFIPLSDPDITLAEIEAVDAAMRSPRLSSGPAVEAFEAAFAAYVGRKYAVAIPSGTLGLLFALRAYGIGPGQEVIASSYSFRETAHAISIAGARPVFADIDYWAGTLVPDKVEARITANTRAIVACNTNGHPAEWSGLRAVAKKHGLVLIEDSTEAIGSRYRGALVGTFGDVAVFDFSQPSALTCGEGGMVIQHLYYRHVQSFEGIKDPYVGPNVTEVNWFLYVVHLGTRFTRSSRDAIVEDLRIEQVEAAAYCNPLHLQRHYFELGYRRGDYFVSEKVADRAVALPFHTHLTEDQIEFIVGTMKDASINVGAGAAIY